MMHAIARWRRATCASTGACSSASGRRASTAGRSARHAPPSRRTAVLPERRGRTGRRVPPLSALPSRDVARRRGVARHVEYRVARPGADRRGTGRRRARRRPRWPPAWAWASGTCGACSSVTSARRPSRWRRRDASCSRSSSSRRRASPWPRSPRRRDSGACDASTMPSGALPAPGKQPARVPRLRRPTRDAVHRDAQARLPATVRLGAMIAFLAARAVDGVEVVEPRPVRAHDRDRRAHRQRGDRAAAVRTSSPPSSSRTCGRCCPSWRGSGACSTSTPTSRPSARTSPPIAAWRRSWRSVPPSHARRMGRLRARRPRRAGAAGHGRRRASSRRHARCAHRHAGAGVRQRRRAALAHVPHGRAHGRERPASLPMPRARIDALVALARTVVENPRLLEPVGTSDDAVARLLNCPGSVPGRRSTGRCARSATATRSPRRTSASCAARSSRAAASGRRRRRCSRARNAGARGAPTPRSTCGHRTARRFPHSPPEEIIAMHDSTHDRAARFRALHAGPALLVLPNAWDAGSARVIEQAGAPAIATSSAGGRLDARLSRRAGSPAGRAGGGGAGHRTHRRRAGLGRHRGGLRRRCGGAAATVARVIDAGAVGINVEDGRDAPDLLCAKIERIRTAARRAGVELWVNARTDVYLRGLVPPGRRTRRPSPGPGGIATPARTRCSSRAVRGADIAGWSSTSRCRSTCSPGPACRPRDAGGLGVRRLSAGTGIALAAHARTYEAARAFLGLEPDGAAIGHGGPERADAR